MKKAIIWVLLIASVIFLTSTLAFIGIRNISKEFAAHLYNNHNQSATFTGKIEFIRVSFREKYNKHKYSRKHHWLNVVFCCRYEGETHIVDKIVVFSLIPYGNWNHNDYSAWEKNPDGSLTQVR